MDLLFCLRDILSEFRHLFNQQSFALFQAFIFGLIANKGTSGTLTELYQCSGSQRVRKVFGSEFMRLVRFVRPNKYPKCYSLANIAKRVWH